MQNVFLVKHLYKKYISSNDNTNLVKFINSTEINYFWR